jgi:hypothetical protein
VQQRHLWSAAKLAVRAYARDPSERNAAEVRQAWQRIRQSESLAIWKAMKPGRLDREALFPYAETINGEAREGADSQTEKRRAGT